jgi:hypothetical protein
VGAHPIWLRKYAIVKLKESDEAQTMEKKLSNYANETPIVRPNYPIYDLP